MARLSRNKDILNHYYSPAKIYWMLYVNIMLTVGLYIIRFWR